MKPAQLRHVIGATLQTHNVPHCEADVDAIMLVAEPAIPQGKTALLDAVTGAIHSRFPGLE